MAKNRNSDKPTFVKGDDGSVTMAVIDDGLPPSDEKEALAKAMVKEVEDSKELAAPDEIEGIPTYDKSIGAMIEATYPQEEVSVDLEEWKKISSFADSKIEMLPGKPEQFTLIELSQHLARLAKKAESQRNYALAGEFHNALAPIGAALNKVQALSGEAVKFFEEA